jgi:hypothetical protein
VLDHAVRIDADAGDVLGCGLEGWVQMCMRVEFHRRKKRPARSVRSLDEVECAVCHLDIFDGRQQLPRLGRYGPL